MQKILFPTDFSSTADNAFIYALKIAKKLGARIYTLHVYQRPDISGVKLPHTLREVYNSIELEEFENYRDNVPHLHEIAKANGLTDVPIENIMEEGETLPTILKVAKREEIDLIVMGTKGASGLREIFIGSTAAEVLENAECLVLAVPENAVFDGMIDNIAITTEYKPEELIALKRVVEFAGIFGANVYCVNVDLAHTADLDHKMDHWKEQYPGNGKVQFRVLDGTDIQEGLSKFINEEKIDILAMLTRKRNFFQELFHYSMVKKMAYHLNTPIMAIRN